MKPLLGGALRRFASLFRKSRLDAELDDEVRFHLEMETRANLERGMGPEEARRAARRSFGGVEQVKEVYRARRGLPWADSLLQDLRYALRTMRRSPVFTAVVLLSLAFGIGTNSAIFGLVDALLLQLLPVHEADRLVLLEKADRNEKTPLFSWTELARLQAGCTACSGVLGYTAPFDLVLRPPTLRNTSGEQQGDQLQQDQPRRAGRAGRPGGPDQQGPPAAPSLAEETAAGQIVSGNFFTLLGVRAAAGRAFTAADDAVPNGQPVAVISYGYWQRHLALDPAAVGRTLVVNGVPLTIVGVAPRAFSGVIVDQAPDVFLPISMQAATRGYADVRTQGEGNHELPLWNQLNVQWLNVMARLAPATSARQAAAELTVLLRQVTAQEALTQNDAQTRLDLLSETVVLSPGGHGVSDLRRRFTRPLLILMVVALLVLLIACTNVASLLLARADGRRREMAVRLGIGAGRGRLIRQLLTESLLLSFLGGALGLLFAHWGSALLLGLVSRSALRALDLSVDLRRVAFAAAVALVTGVAFGLAPALQSTRLDLSSALKKGASALAGGTQSGKAATGVLGRARLPLGRLLIAVQIGLTLVLLVGAGLFVRSLRNLMGIETGYERQALLLLDLNWQVVDAKGELLLDIYRRLVGRAQALPGVRSASLSLLGLLSGNARTSNFTVPGYAARPGERMDVLQCPVTPGYFATVGIALVGGRDFGPQDRAGAPAVAIINETMARRYFGQGRERSPVGRRFGLGGMRHANDLQVVGVVRDAKSDSNTFREMTQPTAYLPVAQKPEQLYDFEVRTALANPLAIGGPLRQAIAEVEPLLAVSSVATIGEQVDRVLARERAVARLTGFFGLLALLLAAIGLYGVMSYNVARRTNEIGLRMALGAARGQVVAMVLQETARLTVAGVAAGLLAALAAVRLVSSQLFGMTAYDPATLVTATAVLVTVALLAGLLPALRAADTDPMAALRYE
ncbi:MAG TPA: ABC transporter permease [Thermoanaerobaculia bacterium]|nr:ABC transporter permease [Thermoanaerobaculia bacterium]